MAHLSSVALAPLLLEHNDLAVSVLLNNPSYDLRTGHERGTNLGTLVVGHHQDLIDQNLVTHLTIQTLHPNKVPFGCLVLLSPCLEYRIHTLTSMDPKKRIRI